MQPWPLMDLEKVLALWRRGTLVVFGTLRDAFSHGWLPDGSFAAVKAKPVASLDSYIDSLHVTSLEEDSEPDTPTSRREAEAASGVASWGGDHYRGVRQRLWGQVHGRDPRPSQERGARVARHVRQRRGHHCGVRPHRLPHAGIQRDPQLPTPHRLRDRRNGGGHDHRSGRQGGVPRASKLRFFPFVILLLWFSPAEEERRGRNHVHGHGPDLTSRRRVERVS
jgi:hypothetical protein